MTEQPTLQEQIDFFDEWNEKYRSAGFEQIEPESKARGDNVLEILSSLPLRHPRILEVGCGTGWLTERLIEFGPTTAIDLSPRAIEIARRRGLDAEFFAGDFYRHEFQRADFDVGVSVETISMVPDQAQFVAKLATAIKPGGYLILTAQNKFVYERRSDIPPPLPGNIRKWLSRRELMRLLRPHFQVIRTTTVLPKGDMGILRAVYSYKVNRLLGLFFSTATIVRVQEKAGLGHTRVVLARRRGS